MMKRRAWLATLAGTLASGGSAIGAPFPLFYTDAGLFRKAIATAKKIEPLKERITGVTVPHHLLAADLIAETCRLASAKRYRRILLMSPDHFRRCRTAFATSSRNFLTPLGRVETDREAAAALLAASPLVSDSALFSHDHGVQAVLPFIAHYFRGTPIVPVACSIYSKPVEWKALADSLAGLLDDRTLVIQSTDFSHYLTAAEAAQRDAETLRVLAAGDPAGVNDLRQPQHLDSLAALWLQMTLQRQLWKAQGTVVQNRNAIHYGGPPETKETTSYITLVWSPESVPAASLPGEAFYFAGDTHFGRLLAPRLQHASRAAWLEAEVKRHTGGRPLILNFESAVPLPSQSLRPAKYRILSEKEPALAWLKRLGVTAVILANNHRGDAGDDALIAWKEALTGAGIRHADQGEILEFPHFLLAAATDLENTPESRRGLISAGVIKAWHKPDSAKPLIAFLHAGEEYQSAASSRQRQLGDMAEKAGAALVTGCHPHRPSAHWERTARSLRLYSLGNFLFDQAGAANTGCLLEVRFFAQGTWAARRLETGNLFAQLAAKG